MIDTIKGKINSLFNQTNELTDDEAEALIYEYPDILEEEDDEQ